MTVGAALQQGTELLDRGAVLVPRLTAEVLLAHALHCDRTWLYAHSSDELPERAWIHYGRYLDERLRGKPTQYITGIQEFFGREFHVNRHVLIPRPETEHLIEAALKIPAETILDVGTGSGIIAITLALETGRTVFASDISLEAVTLARRNALRHNAPVRLFAGDLLESVRAGSIDLIVSNPPYISDRDGAGMQPEVRDWEPPGALFSGQTGLEVYQKLFEQGRRVLRPGGTLVLELGYDSLPGVRGFLEPYWQEVEIIHDLSGWARVLVARIRDAS